MFSQTETSNRLRVCAVIPTYNERDNIEELVRLIKNEAVIHGFACKIIFIDDSSPDGTGVLIQRIAQSDGDITLLTRPTRKGLGTAYIDGFRHALTKTDCDIIMEMDADLSHNPKELHRLIQAMNTFDVALGSRYINGGIILHWPLKRRIVSSVANLLAQITTGWKVKDCTAGFRAYKASLLQRVDLSKLKARGFDFQVEILQECMKLNASITEVPISFRDRKAAKSKLHIRDMLAFLLTCIRLRMQ